MNKESIYVLLLTIAGALFVCGLVMLIVTMTVNSSSYKYYKATYVAIANLDYVMVRNSYYQLTYHRPQETNPYTNDEIIFFMNRHGEVDSIKLLTRPSDNHYIHSKGGSDLYAKYWFKKIINAREKYNYSHWLTTTEQRTEREYITGSIEHREPFKFLRG
jgi:hypothetical protein